MPVAPRASRRRAGTVLGAVLLILVALVIVRLARSGHPTAAAAPPSATAPTASTASTVPSVEGVPPSTTPSPSPSTTPAAVVVPRPPIVWKPIPFPASRKAEMATYAMANSGIDSWRLTDPRVIVEHFTAGTSFSSVFNYFSSDAPDPELHAVPGICSHFVIDTDGTIYQLVPLDVMCRHTVGLNWTAIGIEDVGTSDAEVLHDARQLASSLALTVWLMQRFHIQLRNVIGHNESLTSPYHHELNPAWQCQTHMDWSHADMQTYRTLLAAQAERYGVPLGPPAQPVVPSC